MQDTCTKMQHQPLPSERTGKPSIGRQRDHGTSSRTGNLHDKLREGRHRCRWKRRGSMLEDEQIRIERKRTR
jgi:hypothetical protein